VSFEEVVNPSGPGCCRTASGSFGTYEGPYNVASHAVCEAACNARADCTGYEMNEPPLSSTPKCEIHTSPDDFHHTAVVNGCSCFGKHVVGLEQQTNNQQGAAANAEPNRRSSVGGAGTHDAASLSASEVASIVAALLMIVSVAAALVAEKGVVLRRCAGGPTPVDGGEWDDSW